jgi:hypothetical protein
MYTNQKHLNSLKWVLLEIKLPREINKSPFATELAIASLLQTGGVGDKLSRTFKGSLPVYSSLEIASIEGVIHFYVRIQTKFRPLVEANFYAQYPGIEIVEAEDYTSKIHFNHLSKDVSMYGINYRTLKKWAPINPKTGEPWMDGKKEKEMPADFLPIKTYVDYGLDKDPKEEYKVDPLTPLLEMMGGIRKGEHFWYQILIQSEAVYDDRRFSKLYVDPDHNHISLADMAKLAKEKIRSSGWNIEGKKVVDEFGVPKIIDSYSYDEKTDTYTRNTTKQTRDGKEIDVPDQKVATYLKTKQTFKKETDLTPEEKDQLEAINKKLSKPLALCVMRAIYVAKKENYNGGDNIQKLLALTKPFIGANEFAPSTTTPYDYDWQNFRGRRIPWRSEEKFEEYVEREGFYPHIQIGNRDTLDKWEDQFFWPLTMKHRKTFRMMYEAIFHPFEHPDPMKQAFVLNLEEVATLWHLPGATANVPTLPRIDSAKGVAPSNLPI